MKITCEFQLWLFSSTCLLGFVDGLLRVHMALRMSSNWLCSPQCPGTLDPHCLLCASSGIACTSNHLIYIMLGLNPGLHECQINTLPVELSCQPLCFFFKEKYKWVVPQPFVFLNIMCLHSVNSWPGVSYYIYNKHVGQIC